MRNIRRKQLIPCVVPLSVVLALCVNHQAWADATITPIASFDGSNGAQPIAGLILDNSNDLLGVAQNGGMYGDGSFFEVVAGTTTIIPRASFDGTDGQQPQVSLLPDASSNLFGTASIGGAYGAGTVFEIPAGTTSTIMPLVSFAGFGTNPKGLVADSAGNLYGTTTVGGDYGQGTVFEFAASSNALITIASFNVSDGAQPGGGVIRDASGNLYGTTVGGGADGDGVFFKIAAGSTTITPLATFTGINGTAPAFGLITDSSGNFYGITNAGGANNEGTVFKIAASTNAITTIASFGGTNGAYPDASLIADAAGNLYGTTSQGGANGLGTVFVAAPGSDTLTTLASFSGGNGANPAAGLVADPTGVLYGTARNGGANNLGTLFEVTGSGFVPTITTQQVTRTPASSLTTVFTPVAPTIVTLQNNTVQVKNNDPNSQGLLVYSNGQLSPNGTINQSEPTIVLTHGWMTNATSTWNQFASQIHSVEPAVNIVAWNWSTDADTSFLGLGYATSRTNNEGEELGESLVSVLGPNYARDIHFFGHSLGTLVNAEAVNIFEAHEHDGNNTQVTMFDDAEAGNEFTPVGTPWANSVPLSSVAAIDNYVSAFGNLVLLNNATNVILDSSQSPTNILGSHDLPDFHGYPVSWYGTTIPPGGNNPTVGYGWAIDNASSNGFPAGLQFYAQAPSPGNPLTLQSINGASAMNMITQRDNSETTVTSVSSNIVGYLTSNTIQTVGNVTSSIAQFSSSLDLTTILGSSPLLAVKPGAVGHSITTQTASPSYAWVQVHIPSDAQTLSLDFVFNNVDPTDILTIGIDDKQIFALEGAFVQNGILENTGQLDISTWAGEDVELFMGDTGIAADGTMTVDNITIQEVPEPATIGFMATGILLLLGWERRSRIFAAQ